MCSAHQKTRHRTKAWAVGLAAGVLAGCATTERPDPLENMNRRVFEFNDRVDKYVLVPPARLYRGVVPQPVRVGVDNFFNNLKDAWSSVNLVLQGRIGDASSDAMRFSVNSVLGLGGLLDWGSELGLEPHREDFGQTLGRWGFEPGAYLVLPVLGSSTVRDVIGLPIDLKASPDQIARAVSARNTLSAVRIVNTRAGLLSATDLLDDIALDRYTFVRDAYLQRRRSLVHDGEPPDEERGDDVGASPQPPAVAAGTPAAAPPEAAASAPRAPSPP